MELKIEEKGRIHCFKSVASGPSWLGRVDPNSGKIFIQAFEERSLLINKLKPIFKKNISSMPLSLF